MEFETGLNLFLTFVNVVSVWLISSSIDKHTAAMKIHREYLEKQNAAMKIHREYLEKQNAAD